MVQFNDATNAFWTYLVGSRIGVPEITNDAQLRDLMELDGVAGDILFPGSALSSGIDIDENEGTGIITVPDTTTEWYNREKADEIFVDIADAVALSNVAGAKGTTAGFAGTANTAARGDHSHPIQYGMAYPLLGTAGHVWSYPVGSIGPGAAVNNKCALVPLPVPRRMTLQELCLRINTAGDAGTVKTAIYATAANGLPTGAPLHTSADLGFASGNKTVSAINLTLDPGLYFVAFGSAGFTTTRAIPRQLISNVVAEQYLATIATVGGQGDTTPGLFATGFNESTGAFPTLTGATSDYLQLPGGTSGWFYGIKAIAA